MNHKIESIEQLREVIGAEVPGLADKNVDYIDSYAREFISKCPFVILSTADRAGNVDASPKGDEPGFVIVEDDRTLVIPDRPGNKLAYGHQNILANPQVGLLFIIPRTAETLRINGRAELTRDPELLQKLAARNKPAVLGIRVSVQESFFHCGKAFIRSKLWRSDEWPAERHRVSFGEMYVQRTGRERKLVDKIDQSIEDDYRDNL